MLGSPESKPAFLSDKSLEPVIKNIIRKFPTIDTKSSSVSLILILKCQYISDFLRIASINPHFYLQSQLSAVNQIKAEVIKSLSLYYYTFVDIMDFRVCICCNI